MIILINGWFLHKPNTGSGQYLNMLIKYLGSHTSQSDVHIISPTYAHIPEYCTLHIHETKYNQINKFVFEQIIVPRTAKRIEAEVLHIPYWAPLFRSPCPMVVTIHDIIPMLLPEHKRSIAARLYTAIAVSATHGADQIITDSDYSRNDILEHIKIPSSRVHTIKLGIDEKFTSHNNSPSSKIVRKKYNLPDTYVLYLGGFQRHKNIRHLLAAWTWAETIATNECQLIIAGLLPKAPDGYLYDNLPNIASNLGISDTVKFIGEIEEVDKPTLYQMASCFIFPSSYEGFGLPPLEAMASGTPVVTTNLGALKEIVGDAAYLISDPTDAREMGAAMISVIVDDQLCSDLQKRGLLHAAKYKWEQTVVETIKIYQKAIDL